ncbi:I78 family peptidase inhibitor [Kitasatospora sp. NPDC096147]|uniref:I78 family peptidase inhibitor n=1 Tax=Kitasatospora sp. NPDC096147 TaxID=3364093 RepID=UPI0037FD0610
MDEDAYTGLTREAAERLAAEQGWRTVRVLAPGALITLEYREDRLNLQVRDGLVERCWQG